MPVEERWVYLKGLWVHYWLAGDKRDTVVLIHGGGFDNAYSSYFSLLNRLAPYFTVYAPDLPGYGSSGKPKAILNKDYYISFVKDFVDMLGLKKIYLVGSSMGGAVCLGYCLENPDRVSKLVLVGSHGLGRTIPLQIPSWIMIISLPINRLLWWLFGLNPLLTGIGLKCIICHSSNVTPGMIAEVRDTCRKSRQGTIFHLWQKTEVSIKGMKTNYSGLLERVQCPTLLLHGANDKIVPVSWSLMAASKITRAKLRVIENCGHWPAREHQDCFAEIVLGFLLEQNTQ